MNTYLNAKELKEQASIVDFLARLGHQPVRKGPRDWLYRSILRENDSNPSLSVNDQMGVWYDHGTGKGGNIIDLGLACWKNLTFNEVVEKLNEVCSAQIVEKPVTRPRKAVKVPHYIIEEIKELGNNPAITEYLSKRQIFDVAKAQLKEVYYYVEDEKKLRKHFFAAGWQNEFGGWEVRNKYFKGCLGRKGISNIPGHPKNVAVFEGFINYLSWLTEEPGTESVIVLNTLALLGNGIAKAKEFSAIDLYFDRDAAGHQATKDFIKALPYATDRSQLYAGYNDYNDKITAPAPKPVLKR